uniref:Zinc finger, CCHC-type n=1 Tax=Tanacetum cinerariifolium TaxID=118510 RepID=A0A6L2MF68_TANCI|nr:hypothetical protein [Tanacetum cinerariifolium]
MLLTMDLDIQRNLTHFGAYDMLQKLKAMFSKQAEQELLQTIREFHAYKQKEGQTVSPYILQMKGYIDNLEPLGQPIGQNLAVSLILVSLSKNYDSFVQNYNMHGMGKIVNELHAMLKLHEDTLPKKDANPALHAIRAGRALEKELSRVSRRVDEKEEGLRGSKKLKPGALSLYVGDGHRAAVEAIGTYHLELPSRLVIVLNNCHYAPSITRGVILVLPLFDDGFINRFDENNVISVLKNNLVYFMAVSRDGIFEIDMYYSNTNDSSMYVVSNKRAKINLDSSLLWHCRLGHISKKRIEKLQHDGLLNSIDITSLGKCVSCMSRKMARKPSSHKVERAKVLLGLIHRHGYVYLLKHKHEVFETFKVFQKEVENQLGKTIKSLRSDREERRNRTLLDMVRSMMSQPTLSKSFWDYALETAARILNMVPTKKVDKTPYEIWHGQAPKLSYLKVWGYEALVKRDTLTKPDKLDPRSFRCIFAGYPKETMRYSLYSPSENKVFVAQNAKFFENDLIDLKASESVEDLELIQEEDTNPSLDTSLDHEEDDQEIDEPQSDINPIRKSSRIRLALDRMYLYIDAEEHELGHLVRILWIQKMMNVEMHSIQDELPPNARTVGSKWLFKKKTDMDGVLYVFKARLVAKGFTQTYEVDYEETFSLVADIRAIRLLIAIAAQWNKRFDDEIKKFGFTQNHDEPCAYQKASRSYVAILILYVDDILLMANNIPMLKDVKSYLERSFAIKDLGDVAYILGIKIYRDMSKRLIGFCQSAYVEKILKRYYMDNSKHGTIPMQEKLKLSNMERELRVSCYTDARYLTDADDLKSQTGYVTHCDNTGATTIASDDRVTKGARHFRAKVHFLRETIKLGDVKIEKVDTYDNLADPFTKALAFSKHSDLTRNIRMFPASSFM